MNPCRYSSASLNLSVESIGFIFVTFLKLATSCLFISLGKNLSRVYHHCVYIYFYIGLNVLDFDAVQFLCTKKKENPASVLAPHAVELCAPLSPQREVSFHNVAGLSAQFSKWAEACTVRYSISVSPPTLR